MLVILIIFLTFPAHYSDKKLSSTPRKVNAIQLKELFTLKDKDGFYQRASASTSENGMTAVLDAGNKSIHIFDKNGKHIRVFGEEGNGPGELSRPFRIFTSKDRIYVREDMRVNCYDFTGKHIRDYSLMVAGSVGTPMIMDNHLAVSFRGNSKYLYVVFDDEGNQIEAVDNKTYEQPKGDQGVQVMINSSFKIIPAPDGFVKAEDGTYRFSFLDKKMNETQAFVRDYERVKRDFSKFKINIDDDSMTKEQLAKEMQRARQSMMKRFGEFQDDVASVLGFYNGRLFIQTAAEGDGNLKIDVIENGELYTQISLESEDDIQEARISGGKLVICYKNDSVGPFAKVFDLKSI